MACGSGMRLLRHCVLLEARSCACLAQAVAAASAAAEQSLPRLPQAIYLAVRQQPASTEGVQWVHTSDQHEQRHYC
jgi:hypothetical protein